MVATTTEILTVNGVLLNTLAKNVESLAGRLRAPAFRTGNIVIPGSHGEMWVPNKKFQANTLALPMWVVGCNDDGAIPSGSSKRREFFKRIDELVTLFKGPELLDMRHTLADGSIRQALVECLDVIDFSHDPSPRGMVGVVLTMPGSFWRDVADKVQTFPGNLAVADPSTFRGGSAPMEDLVYELVGPWSNPKITFSDGTFFRYDEVIPADRSLIVNCGEWDLEGTGGLVPDFTKLVHDGADPIWGALPASAAAITLEGTGKTSATAFRITGRRKFLVG